MGYPSGGGQGTLIRPIQDGCQNSLNSSGNAGGCDTSIVNLLFGPDFTPFGTASV